MPKAAARTTALAAPELLPRKVLVLYDSLDGLDPEVNIVREGWQMVLDYHGLVAYYRDVKYQALPDAAAMAETCAVVTLLSQNSMRKPRPYLPWLLGQLKAGKRVIILGHLGISRIHGADLGAVEQLSRAVFAELGVKPAETKGLDLRAYRYGRKPAELIEFERALPAQPVVNNLFEAPAAGVRPYLTLTHPGRPGAEFLAVFTGPRGGFVDESFIYWEDRATFKRKWHVNPFAFVEEALGLREHIAPDVTTLNGLRMAFTHVDADGFAGFTRVNPKQFCAEVIRDRVVKRFALPMTLSLIVADVDPKIATDPKLAKKAQEVARELFRLDNVEPGSHTYSHPFYWNAESKSKDSYEYRFPYSIPGYTFSEAQEIDGSIRYISSLSPANKPCRILQWSGDCLPTARQIERADALGVLNINGGDTLYDRQNNSLTHVSSLYRVVENRIQHHTGQANENIMTNNWTGPFYGFRNMIETMQRTGSPRRLKPINIYYHFYSAEHVASLKALEEVHSWVLAQPIAPVFTSQYLEAARDYHKVRILRAGPGLYHIENYGQSLTLRLDPGMPDPNLERSENVLGYSRQKEGFYVSLAPGAARAVLSLETLPRKSALRPFLAEATGFVSDFKPAPGGVSLTYRGFGTAGRIRLAGFAPGAALRASGTALAQSANLRADAQGFADVPALCSGRLEVNAP